MDGVYEGNICYGKTPQRPNRCYPSAGTVRGKKITGQWIVPKQEGLTLFLEGDVGPSGDVKLHIHSQQPDGTVVATINMTGSIVDGKLEATGNFVNGRPANLFWRRKETIVPLPATK